MSKIFDGYVLVSDMDGTLIGSDNKISKGNIDAINYFINEGGKFTVATGRMLPSVLEYKESLNVNLPILIHNGGKIYDLDKEKIISEVFIEENRKEAIKRIANDYPNLGIEIFSNEIVYVYRKCRFTERYNKYNYDIVYDVEDDVWNKNWVKVLIIGEEELNEIEKIYSEKYDTGSAYRSGSNYFDVVGNGVSKGQALKTLVETYKIDRDKVIAVGDNMNDIEMLQEAKYGFVVANGEKRVKEKITLAAPSCDEDAIKFVIEYLKDKIYNNVLQTNNL